MHRGYAQYIVDSSLDGSHDAASVHEISCVYATHTHTHTHIHTHTPPPQHHTTTQPQLQYQAMKYPARQNSCRLFSTPHDIKLLKCKKMHPHYVCF